MPLYGARAEGEEASSTPAEAVTAECTITLPEELTGKEYRITDGLIESYQTFRSGQSVQIDLPQGAQGLYLEWYGATSQYTVVQYDASGATLLEEAASAFVNAYYPLLSDAARVSISFLGEASLSGVSVYGAGELPGDVQRWSAPGASDLLVVASNSVTALDEFFGVIATYACNHDIPTALVVMSRGTRSAQQELLSALWYAGYDQYPYFGEFTSVNDSIYKMVRNGWGRKPTLTFITERIEAFAPKVIVTHMDDESAPDGTAQMTGEYTLRAAEDLEIQKLYFASETGTTKLDFTEPLNGCAGRTALELAAEAFTLCTTRHAFETELIPSSAFLLEQTAVGEDTAGGDLFEHIDSAALRNYVDPTPTPQPTPVPTEPPAAEPDTAEDTAAPAAVSSASQEEKEAFRIESVLTTLGANERIRIGIAIGGGALTLLLLIVAALRWRRIRSRGGAVVLSLLPLLLGLLVSSALHYYGKKQIAEETPLETPVPTATATPSAEPTPTPDASAEQQAETAASAADEYYRQADEPEEVIVADEEAGHWEYRTDTLSITINRVNTEYVNYGGKTYPLVYFVAHIRMREVDQFRTVQAADNRNGAGAIKPWILARRSKAVLMITGDNLTESDTQYKSMLIRDGKVFLDSGKGDFIAMYPDMTLRIFSPGEINAEGLLMDGVRDVFSFGPTMIRNGEFTTENIDKVPRIANETNPRTGIGMVEPGHFVAIVVDGRQKDYSYGMRLSAFAQLFVEEGCVEAYNLDGGVSACMLFMGEQLNRHGNKRVGTIEDSYQRRIPDGLVWGYSEQVPSEDDPIYNRGEG